jgi:glycosyltransferase involved in cell wall biosynthesis
MRNALLITYSYPPVDRSGARRPAGLAKYLPQFGWKPLVLTPKTQGITRTSEQVIETDYQDVIADWKTRLHLDGGRGIHEQFRLPLSTQPGVDKPHTLLITLVRNMLAYPDQSKGWIAYALKAVEELPARGRRIDAIVTTFPPASCHIIGKKAKEILGCPWIADFRDLWTQDITTIRRRDLVFLQVPLEKRTLRSADVLVTVSDPWADRLRQRYRSKDVAVIPNAFDPNEFSSRPKLAPEFTITHAGTLYQGQRDPTVLFEVLQDLLATGKILRHDLRVRFYGPAYAWLRALIDRFGLQSVVQVNGPIDRREVLQREMESQVLLILSWTHPKDTGLHTGKLFEYLGTQRPVLAIGGNRGAMTEVLEETMAGPHLCSKQDLRVFLIKAYEEYKRLGYVSYRGKTEMIFKYSHIEMSRRFAEVLDRVAGGTACASSSITEPEMIGDKR